MTIIWIKSIILLQCYREERFVNHRGVIIDVNGDPDSASFKSK